jgi:hypothetical protein
MNCTDSTESDAALTELIAKYHEGGASWPWTLQVRGPHDSIRLCCKAGTPESAFRDILREQLLNLGAGQDFRPGM